MPPSSTSSTPLTENEQQQHTLYKQAASSSKLHLVKSRIVSPNIAKASGNGASSTHSKTSNSDARNDNDSKLSMLSYSSASSSAKSKKRQSNDVMAEYLGKRSKMMRTKNTNAAAGDN
ncbi:hypothetical protein SeLEV6574_g04146 [Synchytrium endobioticum]|uniref:Uncharacterized protein n=1 Tax=Synchytrium endobioticum TaxID=286115 RepID=A0A507D0T6_9FUNG|nr:hypothetical protein SeLEV6574_g04146 [Synchytrium endobioticum]